MGALLALKVGEGDTQVGMGASAGLRGALDASQQLSPRDPESPSGCRMRES